MRSTEGSWRMPANQSLGVGRSRRIDTAVRQIDVATGPLILTTPDNEAAVLNGGEQANYDPPLAGVLAYAPDGSRFHVVYETDPADSEERRDRPGSGKKRAASKRKQASKKRSTSRRASSTAKSTSKAKASGSKSASKPKAKSRSTRKKS